MQQIRLILVLTALLVTVVGTTIFAGVRTVSASSTHLTQSTHLHVTCSGQRCNGQDPEVTGCAADAYTVQTGVLSTAFVQLRFSPRCGTNWGRVISRVGLAHLFVRIERIDGLSCSGSISTGSLVFSPMVYAPVVKARACGTVKAVSGCTAFV
jgi:hypothetical protein